MMLTIKKETERTNLHSAAHASLNAGSSDARNAHDGDWDVEGVEVGQGIRGVVGTENTEGVAGGATVVALGRGQGRGAQELNLTEEADRSGEASNWGLDGLAHITEDQVARAARSRHGGGDGSLESSRGNGHVARWVVADSVAGRGVKLVAIGGGGGSDGGGAVVRVGRGDLANETSNR